MSATNTITSTSSTLTTPVKVKPLAQTFAAEVEGVDFSQPISDDVFHQLQDIIGTYGVVVFRKTSLDTDAAQIAFGRRFGELDTVAFHRKAGRAMRLPDDEIFDVSNLDDKDQVVKPNDPMRVAQANGNALWHADGSFNARRLFLSMLRAVELPPSGSGGETEFLDCRQAYTDLPGTKKEEIKNYVALHSIFHNRKTANPDNEYFKAIDVLDNPMAKHKVVQIHQASGRPTLYVTSYAHHLDGEPVEEGKVKVNELFQHIQQDKYKYVLHWENPGDFVIWDNTSVLHRATHGNYEGNHRRDMRRVSCLDSGKEAWGLNDPNADWKQGLP